MYSVENILTGKIWAFVLWVRTVMHCGEINEVSAMIFCNCVMIDIPVFRWYSMGKFNKRFTKASMKTESAVVFSESRGWWKPGKKPWKFPSLLSRKPQRFITQ